jgi:catechol 2,3-dioxygenase-like lactoylglutathione lyase family enzyme
MINGAHVLIYTQDEDATRAFFRDVLELANVDAGGGWLIFQLPPAELGVHPLGTGVVPGANAVDTHRLSLMCDDIGATVVELEAKGVTFTGPVEDQGFGLTTDMVVPGGVIVQLYEPRHPVAHSLSD